MIDLFKTWLPAIVGYAEMVVDGRLRRAWESNDRSETSTYYSGELEVQVFDDLDSENMRWEMRQALKDSPELIEAIELFLHAIKNLISWADRHVDVDTWGRGKVIPAGVPRIFDTNEWRDTLRYAREVIATADNAGISGD